MSVSLRTTIGLGLLVTSLAAGPGALTQGRAAPSPSLAEVAAAMGADRIRTIEFAGGGYSFGYEQAPGPGEPWPMFVADTYRVAVDYTFPAMRFETTRAQGEVPPRGGGGQPVAGNPRSVQFLSGTNAWSESASGVVQPNLGAVPVRRRQISMTPQGIVKAAQAARIEPSGSRLRLDLEGLPVVVTLSQKALVERLEFTIDSPVLGDVPVQVRYEEYRDIDGVRFPTRIIETTDGYLTWDITIRDVRPNAPVSISAPSALAEASVRAGIPQGQRLEETQVSSGVWHLTAGGYASTVVEFADFLVLFEAPLNDARSAAILEWARATRPGKSIRFVVNTHSHFDHAGGLRAFVAEGATIVTHEMNRSYYEAVWQRPRTLVADALALRPRVPVWDTMTERKTISDGVRVLELYKLLGNGHHPYLIVGHLPRERLLLYGDMYNPPAGDDPRDLGRTNEFAANLFENITERLRLDIATLVPVHGRPVPFDNLRRAIGK